jgi:hypothetical protein
MAGNRFSPFSSDINLNPASAKLAKTVSAAALAIKSVHGRRVRANDGNPFFKSHNWQPVPDLSARVKAR